MKYKPRKKSSFPVIKNITDKVNRTFTDFVKYIEENPGVQVVEMDTVHDTRSGKVLLTFQFRNCSLMLAFILNSCGSMSI